MENFWIEANLITPKQIYFNCPCCWSKYKKNGEPYKNAKRVRHIHGNCTGTDVNRNTTRTPHCIKKPEEGEFIIRITENTIKRGFKPF
jgi:hypothetical protein